MNRIIGVGNAFVEADCAGPRVCEHLLGRPLPPEVEVVDGGLAGLNLLRLFDGAARVVLVDQVEGFCPGGGAVVLSAAQAAARPPARHDHGAGIPFLLRALPLTCASPAPDVWLVGVEGPAEPELIRQAAELALALATGEEVSCR